MSTIHPEVLQEARKQIGLLLQSIRKDKKIPIRELSHITGLTDKQIIAIEHNRVNYTIDSFLKYIQALDVYFFLSEKDGHHLDINHMVDKADPDKAAL